MLFDKRQNKEDLSLKDIPLFWKILFFAMVWFIIISSAHYHLNGNVYDKASGRVIRMGYMPVISNLACPLLDYASRENEKLKFNAVKFFSFAEMGEAFRNNHIQVAFIIAPLAVMLRQQGEDVKIVYIGNRHESTLVVDQNLIIENISDLAGKTLAVPMRYSGHYLWVQELIERNGLKGQINVVEINPPDMASALAAKSISAYFVGEPFAAQAIRRGDARVLFYGEELWPGFICNLMIVRQDFIQKDPDLVQKLVDGAARSGVWAEANPKKAASIASKYWNQSVDVVEFALSHPDNRIVYNQYVPQEKELEHLAGLMKHFGLSDSSDISGLIDDHFSRNVSLQNITDLSSILQ